MKVMAILHLCLVFSLLAWVSAEPFMGDLYRFKSTAMIYQTLQGHPEILERIAPAKATEMKEKMERHRQRYLSLPPAERELIEKNYQQMQEQTHLPWHVKLKISLESLTSRISPLERLWMVLSILLAICTLKQTEGLSQAIWLLPLTFACFAWDNLAYSPPAPPPADAVLFPSEKELVERSLKEPLEKEFWKQQEQLEKAWPLYLVTEYAKEIPATDPLSFQQQLEKGEFAFLLARVKKLAPETQVAPRSPQRHSALYLGVLGLWNWIVARNVRKRIKAKNLVPEKVPSTRKSPSIPCP